MAAREPDATTFPHAAAQGEPVRVPETKSERIRDAALHCFAATGVKATSLREIATSAGVSIGLVQHHFGNKQRLVRAVDEHVMVMLNDFFTAPADPVPTQPVEDVGRRVTTLLTTHPDVVDYIGRLLIDGEQTGSIIFDALASMGEARWTSYRDRQLASPDLDCTWAALNTLLLVLGAILLRPHVDRRLPAPLTTPDQMSRWEESVNTMIRSGLYHRPS